MLDTQKELASWLSLQIKELPSGVDNNNCRLVFAKGKLSDGKPSFGVSFQDYKTGVAYGVSPVSNQLHTTMTDLTSHFALKPQTKPMDK